MSKFDKIKDLARIGLKVGIALTPGGRVKDVISIINSGIADKTDPQNENSLRALAEVDDAVIAVLKEQQQQIVELQKQVRELQNKR